MPGVLQSPSDASLPGPPYAALALSLTEQPWNRLGIEQKLDQEYNAEVITPVRSAIDEDTIVDSVTALLLIRIVAVAVCREQQLNDNSDTTHTPSIFPDYSTSTICRMVLVLKRPWQAYAPTITDNVISQLRQFVAKIIHGYSDLPYHNYEHAFHVVLSANKLIDMMLTQPKRTTKSFGLRNDPIKLCALIFAALILDVEHLGISNLQLIAEGNELAMTYNGQSISENMSISVGFRELLKENYQELRSVLFNGGLNSNEYQKFYMSTVNLVLSTDIASPERAQISRSKWKEAFGDPFETVERKFIKMQKSSESNISDSPSITPDSSGEEDEGAEKLNNERAFVSVAASSDLPSLCENSELKESVQPNPDPFAALQVANSNFLRNVAKYGGDPAIMEYPDETRNMYHNGAPLSPSRSARGIIAHSDDVSDHYTESSEGDDGNGSDKRNRSKNKRVSFSLSGAPESELNEYYIESPDHIVAPRKQIENDDVVEDKHVPSSQVSQALNLCCTGVFRWLLDSKVRRRPILHEPNEPTETTEIISMLALERCNDKNTTASGNPEQRNNRISNIESSKGAFHGEVEMNDFKARGTSNVGKEQGLAPGGFTSIDLQIQNSKTPNICPENPFNRSPVALENRPVNGGTTLGKIQKGDRASKLREITNSPKFKRRLRTRFNAPVPLSFRKRLGIRRSMDLSGEELDMYHLRVSNRPSSLDDNDEPDELKVSVILETILTAADVAHHLQGWEQMVNWSSRLYMELRKAYKQGKGADPKSRWFENQIIFLESYVLPLAHRLEDTGVFGSEQGQVFASIVEANRDKWIADGREVTKNILRLAKKQRVAKQSALNNKTNDIKNTMVLTMNGWYLILVMYLVFCAYAIRKFHVQDTSLIRRGDIVKPGTWRSRCGMKVLIPRFVSTLVPELECTNYYLRVGLKDGIVRFYNAESKEIGRIEGRVCPTGSECIEGLHFRSDGKLFFGGKQVNLLLASKKYSKIFEKWPFDEISTITVKRVEKYNPIKP